MLDPEFTRLKIVVIAYIIIVIISAACIYAYNRDIGEKNKKLFRDINSTIDFFRAGGKFSNEGDELEVHGDFKKWTIFIGDVLSKNLDAICENFKKATSIPDAITGDEFRRLLTDDFVQCYKNFRKEKKSYIVYRIFEWCGQSARENVVYVGESDSEEAFSKNFEDDKPTNYDFIVSLENVKEVGGTYPFKFKWQ